MEKKLHEAVLKAIKAVGIDAFKRTSLFLSNEKAAVELKIWPSNPESETVKAEFLKKLEEL